MNDKLLIILLRGILDIGDGKRKCRDWLEVLQAKQLADAKAAPPAPTQQPASTKPISGGKA